MKDGTRRQMEADFMPLSSFYRAFSCLTKKKKTLEFIVKELAFERLEVRQVVFWCYLHYDLRYCPA